MIILFLLCPQPVDNLWKTLNILRLLFSNSVISYKSKEYEFDLNLI